MRTVAVAIVLLAASDNAAADVAPEMTILQAGPGDILPAGRPTGIQVQIDPGDLEAGTYLLEWETETPDGDVLLWQRAIPLAGATTNPWLYGVAPTSFESSGRIRLRRQEDSSPLISLPLVDNLRTVNRLPEGAELLLVIGNQRFGLEAYDIASTSTHYPWSAIDTSVRSLSPSDVPDRPEGLAGASTILCPGSQESLGAHRENVLRNWMQAGGHLIVSLSALGRGDRFAQVDGPIHDLLPPIPEQETLYASQLAPLLSPDALRISPGTETTCRTFPSTTTGDPTWQTVLNLPDGRPLAIARSVGHGRLTLIGLDLTAGILRQFKCEDGPQGTIPAAATFWNPILARRGDAPTPREINEIYAAKGTPAMHLGVPLNDEPVAYATRRTVTVGGRISIVMLWMTACWFIGGPILWICLGRFGRREYAWPLFALLGAAGGAIGWTAGVFMNLQDAEAIHFSLVDQVAGTPERLVRSWIDVRIPGTSTHDLSVPVTDAQAILAPWIESRQQTLGFADADTLVTDVLHPEVLPVKSRSTSTGVQVEWIGLPDHESLIPTLTLVDPVRFNSDGPRGTLRYTGPAPLKDVSIVWIQGRRYPRNTPPGKWTDPVDAGHMPVKAWAWKLSAPIEPDHTISLNNLNPPALEQYLADHAQSVQTSVGFQQFEIEPKRGMDLLSVFRYATPPDWQLAPENAGMSVRYVELKRAFGTHLDLGARLGTPMLLVTGFVQGSKLPVPLLLDGEPVHTTQGTTFLRWIFPLPDVSPILE